MNQLLFKVDKELSKKDKEVYFSFLFDVNVKEVNHRKMRRKIIILLVASLSMLALIIYRATQASFQASELLVPGVILVLLGMQLFFKKKDTRMYDSFMKKYEDQPVQMRYQFYEQMIEVYLGKEYIAYKYNDIYSCKQSRNGIFIELKNQDKKRISILMRPHWNHYQELLDILKQENVHIKKYETSIE